MTEALRTIQGYLRPVPGKPAYWPDRIRNDRSPRRILQASQHLFQAGEPVLEAFIVRTGHLKSYRVHRDGEEQILGMHGPGDVVGFEALVGKPAISSVIALEIAGVEAIDLSRETWRQAEASPDGMAVLVEGMYQELQRFSRLLRMDRHPAERRLAEFLFDFSNDECRRGRSPLDLTLPFNRRDLARFLGLAPETLSRTFSRFQEQGMLSVNNRHIFVLDPRALKEAAG